jgi:hypothetical protein
VAPYTTTSNAFAIEKRDLDVQNGGQTLLCGKLAFFAMTTKTPNLVTTAAILALLCAIASAQPPPIKQVCNNIRDGSPFSYSCDPGTVFVKLVYGFYGVLLAFDPNTCGNTIFNACRTPTITTGTTTASADLARLISTACLGRQSCTVPQPFDPCPYQVKSLHVTFHCQARMFACVLFRGTSSLTFFWLNNFCVCDVSDFEECGVLRNNLPEWRLGACAACAAR